MLQVSMYHHRHLLESQKNQVKYFQEPEDVITRLLRKFHKRSLIAAMLNIPVSTLTSKLVAKFTIPVEVVDVDIPSSARMEQYSLKSTSSVTGGSTLPVQILQIIFY